MYDLHFPEAHRTFTAWEHTHPDDPMGAISDAAAYLFAEFARLHILQSEFFTDDASFDSRERGLAPDPAAKEKFEAALQRGQAMASRILAKSPNDENALLAAVLGHGLQADYLALIEKRNVAGLEEMKQSRGLAEHLLSAYPDCYDAYLAVGVENYMLSLKPAPVRWILRLSGAETDKQEGIARLTLTAQKGRYLLPYARLLLAVAALRDKNVSTARKDLTWLAGQFPDNPLYRQELAKLG